MKIVARQEFIDTAVNTKTVSIQDGELIKLLENSLNKFSDNKKVEINQQEDGSIELIGVNGMALHNFTLRCEELGKRVDYEKRTIIKIR